MVLISLSSLKNLFVDVVLDDSCDAPVFAIFQDRYGQSDLELDVPYRVVEIITLNNMIWK